MSRNPFQLSGLDRLANEHGLDVRATLLRVATDLFCQARSRTPAEIARFADLALPLIDGSDARTREIVAAKLARVADTPRPVIERLLQDLEPAVRRAVHGGPVAATAAPTRPESVSDALALIATGRLDGEQMLALARHPSIVVAQALVGNPRIVLSADALLALIQRGRENASIAAALLRRDVDPAAFAALYLHAAAEMRTRIRIAVERSGAARPAPVAASALAILSQAARSGDREAIATAMAEALGVDPARMLAVFDDPLGDAMALALGAVGLKRAAAITLLLVASAPDVRRSVELIFAAASIHETTPRHVARRIVEAVAGAPAAQRTPRHEPHLDPSGTRERSPRAEHRRVLRFEPGRAREGRRD